MEVLCAVMSGAGGACVGSGLPATTISTHTHIPPPKHIPSSNSSRKILGESFYVLGLARKS